MNDQREPFMPSVELDHGLTHERGHSHVFDFWDTVLSKEVWNKKYRHESDDSIMQTMSRTAHALFPNDVAKALEVADLMYEGVILPAGRILSGAGTGNRVTLMNCYVMGTIDDSLDDIFAKLKESAMTMQQGGGIGIDISPLRPFKAVLKRTGSSSSGPMPFLDTWDAMCKTIMSAGHRRGAMMATMDISHPNIIDFITAKRDKTRLRNFNVSVLVSDEFMRALSEGLDFQLRHETASVEWDDHEKNKRLWKQGGKLYYVWDTVDARALWETLCHNTYEYSEPGVIFIDRINDKNNLKNVESIRCTNPCGEQPLPPYGACDLGHINLARLVLDPYTPEARVDWPLLNKATRVMVEVLDSVIDVTGYPLPEQEKEQTNKRRIGLGVTGLADTLAMLGYRYGSLQAVGPVEKIMHTIARAAYTKSCEMAKELGKAPAYDNTTFNFGFIKSLKDPDLLASISTYGLRNCVLLTVAPTGTTSAFYGNVSSGIEPNFSHRTTRNVRQPDDTYKKFTEYSYSVRYYAHVHKIPIDVAYDFVSGSPQHFPTINDLTIEEHIRMQAAVQKYVDASVSKTVNIPKDTPYEEFEEVYQLAYDMGCKGCTTYRESDVRGSILESARPDAAPLPPPQEPILDKPKEGGSTYTFLGVDLGAPELERGGPSGASAALTVEPVPKTRPKALEGRTYKIKWPGLAAAIYLTINQDDIGDIQEVFISSKNSQYAEWATALSVILSKLLKLSKDPVMVANELMQINLSMNPSWNDGKFYGSIIAQIGALIKEHAEEFADMHEMAKYTDEQFVVATVVSKTTPFETRHTIETDGDPVVIGTTHQCTACGGFNVSMKEGCMTCDDCGQSNCN